MPYAIPATRLPTVLYPENIGAAVGRSVPGHGLGLREICNNPDRHQRAALPPLGGVPVPGGGAQEGGGGHLERGGGPMGSSEAPAYHPGAGQCAEANPGAEHPGGYLGN